MQKIIISFQSPYSITQTCQPKNQRTNQPTRRECDYDYFDYFKERDQLWLWHESLDENQRINLRRQDETAFQLFRVNKNRETKIPLVITN